MKTTRHRLAAALVAAALTGGCGVESSGTDREGQIDQIANDVYAVMGVADRKVAYGYERRSATGCGKKLGLEPGLGADQAWYARKAHPLAPGDYSVDLLFDDAARHFSTQGWTVQEYRTEGGVRALTALRDDVGVLVTVAGAVRDGHGRSVRTGSHRRVPGPVPARGRLASQRPDRAGRMTFCSWVPEGFGSWTSALAEKRSLFR